MRAEAKAARVRAKAKAARDEGFLRLVKLHA